MQVKLCTHQACKGKEGLFTAILHSSQKMHSKNNLLVEICRSTILIQRAESHPIAWRYFLNMHSKNISRDKKQCQERQILPGSVPCSVGKVVNILFMECSIYNGKVWLVLCINISKRKTSRSNQHDYSNLNQPTGEVAFKILLLTKSKVQKIKSQHFSTEYRIYIKSLSEHPFKYTHHPRPVRPSKILSFLCGAPLVILGSLIIIQNHLQLRFLVLLFFMS